MSLDVESGCLLSYVLGLDDAVFKGVRKIFVASLPPEAKKIVKI